MPLHDKILRLSPFRTAQTAPDPCILLMRSSRLLAVSPLPSVSRFCALLRTRFPSSPCVPLSGSRRLALVSVLAQSAISSFRLISFRLVFLVAPIISSHHLQSLIPSCLVLPLILVHLALSSFSAPLLPPCHALITSRLPVRCALGAPRSVQFDSLPHRTLTLDRSGSLKYHICIYILTHILHW